MSNKMPGWDLITNEYDYELIIPTHYRLYTLSAFVVYGVFHELRHAFGGWEASGGL